MSRRRSFGSVYRRKRPDGSLMDGWYIRWSDAGGRRRHRLAGLTKDEAELALLEIRRKLLRQRLLGEEAVEEISVSAWIDRAVEMMKARLAKHTVAGRRATLRRLREKFGRRTANSITSAEIQAHLDALSREGMKPNTLRVELITIRVLFRMAIDANVAAKNPADGVRVGRIVEKPIPWLRRADLHRLYAAAGESIRAAVIVQGELGLRRGEVLGLAWEDFDHALAVATIERTLGSESTKSGRVRRVPVGDLAGRVLVRLRDKGVGPAVGGLTPVFPDVTASLYNREFRMAADSVGMRDLTPHGLRHNWIAHLVRTPGVDLESARRMVGHSSIATTQKYLRAIPDDAAFDAMRAREAGDGDHDALLESL